MSEGWFTMKDVLNDLEKVTGQKIKTFGRNLAVSGEHPPPKITSEEEDEIMKMYGELNCRDSKIEPDLAGITRLLRMVNDQYDDATCNANENIEQLYEIANTVVSISKLNPSVEEFVPRNASHSGNDLQHIEENGVSSNLNHLSVSSTGSKKSICMSLPCNIEESCETDSSNNRSNNNEDIDINKKIDTSNLKLEEINCIKEKLKLKIKDTSKASCPKKKRERNLAIASLLKLHTETKIALTIDNPLKLMTPDDFQTISETSVTREGENVLVRDKHNLNIIQSPVVANESGTDKESINVKIEEALDNAMSILPHENSSEYLQSLSLLTTSTQEETGITNNKTIQPSLEQKTSKEIKESVKKVDDWLNKPEKQKQHASPIFLSAVTFKRKETTCVSPSVEISDRPPSAPTSGSFVPSTYADELTRNYMERCKVKVAQEDIWTKLERKLKEKDKAIKEKM